MLSHYGDGEIERRMHLPLPVLEFAWMGSRHKCTFCSKFQVEFDTYSLSGVERSPTKFLPVQVFNYALFKLLLIATF